MAVTFGAFSRNPICRYLELRCCIFTTMHKSRSRTRGVAKRDFRIPTLHAVHIFFVLGMQCGASIFSFCNTSQLILRFLMLPAGAPRPTKRRRCGSSGMHTCCAAPLATAQCEEKRVVHDYMGRAGGRASRQELLPLGRGAALGGES